MKPRAKTLLLPALGLLLAAAGGWLGAARLTVLSVSNLETGEVRLYRIRPPERFALLYRHSIYDAPVAEELEVGAAGIVLKAVRTEHPGVMEYYGLEEIRGRQRREAALGEALVVKRGVRAGQALEVGGRRLALDEFARPGERVEVRVRTVSGFTYFTQRER